VLALLAVAFAIHLRVGTVVRVHDAERDHWSRTSPPAMLCLVLEGMVASSHGPPEVLPMAFDHFETAGTARSGLPANLEPLTVAQPTDAPG
jgi:hypothetical protein